MPTRSKKPLAEYQRKRDFTKSSEPSGKGSTSSRVKLQFVVQKHEASHLHFDFRVEMDGVMKSWAVPKGPSMDPVVKRLAMQVEDHPIDYNAFEGTIPEGEYGGGTVMIWDRGSYTPDGVDPGAERAAMRSGYEDGKLSITLRGKRLVGSFALVRTRYSETKPQWLLMKHRDASARPGSDVAAEYMTSVTTGRTMEEIAADGNPPKRGRRQPAT
jgi:bifunctional non-homologous end joining protein LigD